MSEHGSLTRRAFLGAAAAAGALGAAAPAVLPPGVLAAEDRPGPNDQVQVALIGCGSMGRENLKNVVKHTGAKVTLLCDVWKARIEEARKIAPGGRPCADYREALAAKDVDAVVIATPPHWHALMAIQACAAGKDLYLQKPMTLTLAESVAVRNAVRRHGRVSQVGTQIHAGENYRRVVELIRSGNLGKVSVVRTFNVMNQGPEGIGHDDSPLPEGLDWEMWIGPGPLRPYNGLLARDAYYHSSFMDYSGGWTPGMAPHILDLPVWALDLGLPLAVSASGGRYLIDDDGDAPDVHEALISYPGLTVTWMSTLVNSYGFDFHGKPVPQRRLGIYFHGSKGTLRCDYDSNVVVPEGDLMKGLEPPKPSIPLAGPRGGVDRLRPVAQGAELERPLSPPRERAHCPRQPRAQAGTDGAAGPGHRAHCGGRGGGPPLGAALPRPLEAPGGVPVAAVRSPRRRRARRAPTPAPSPGAAGRGACRAAPRRGAAGGGSGDPARGGPPPSAPRRGAAGPRSPCRCP